MRRLITAATLSLFISCSALAAGGGGMSGGNSMPRVDTASPVEQARLAYNAGVRNIQKADELTTNAARQTDTRKRDKMHSKARGSYEDALRKFTRATELHPDMHEAWNYVGYSHRKLGNYPAALSAYDRALALAPGYAQAIEYRGHAYLGLDRIAEAKEAYLALYSGNRQLAAQLLAAMQEWVGRHREAPAGVDGASVEAFASWVAERSAIAGQTAALTREGASAAW